MELSLPNSEMILSIAFRNIWKGANYYRSDHHLRPNFFRFFDGCFSLFNSR